ADRILRTSHKFDDKQASMTKELTKIAFSKISTKTFEGPRFGFFRCTDTIIFHTTPFSFTHLTPPPEKIKEK
ncbi:hypothetical protein HGQ74_15120, partial [Staphylococcus aureus]|uniref:hypothetical protein n=1 Tax=Staphylococcus aureus TaxID=1280 RepID=UPI00146D07AD